MATTKTYTVAGSSTLNGKTKLRFTNDIMRIKVLDKNGHDDVKFVDLPSAMTKGEIAQYLMDSDYAQGDAAIINAIKYIAKKNSVTLKDKTVAEHAVPETELATA